MEAVSIENLAQALDRLATARDDPQAWRILFLGSWGTGLSAANRILRGQLDLAQDVTQEAFQRIIKYGDFTRLRDPDAFLSYFRAVCRNVARNALSHFAPELAHDVSLEELEITSPRGNLPDTPEVIFRAKELRDEMLRELNPDDRRLMELLVEGYSLSEIASRLDLSYGTAAVRLHRLRRVLRKYMK